MTHQSATVGSTDEVLTALETFAATYAGYSVIAGAGNTLLTGYNDSRVFRKTGQVDIHISYNGNDNISAQDSKDGAIAFAMDSANSGAGFLWSDSAQTYSGGTVSNYKCPVPIASPAKGCTKYHFFTNGSEIWVAMKLSTYGWMHFGFGMMGYRAGAWTGGTFVMVCNMEVTVSEAIANNPANPNHNFFLGPVYANANSTRTAGRHMLLHIEDDATASPPVKEWGINLSGVGALQSAPRTYLTDISMMHTLDEAFDQTNGYLRAANGYNGRSIGIPFDMLAYDDNVDLWRYIGQIQGIRLINMEYLSEEEIINSDWMVFPLANNGNRDTAWFGNTANLGVAYKKYTVSA